MISITAADLAESERFLIYLLGVAPELKLSAGNQIPQSA